MLALVDVFEPLEFLIQLMESEIGLLHVEKRFAAGSSDKWKRDRVSLT